MDRMDERRTRALEDIARSSKEVNKAILKINDVMTEMLKLLDTIAKLLPEKQTIALGSLVDEMNQDTSRMVAGYPPIRHQHLRVRSDLDGAYNETIRKKIDPRSFSFTKADSLDDCMVCGNNCATHSWNDRVACAKTMNANRELPATCECSSGYCCCSQEDREFSIELKKKDEPNAT